MNTELETLLLEFENSRLIESPVTVKYFDSYRLSGYLKYDEKLKPVLLISLTEEKIDLLSDYVVTRTPEVDEVNTIELNSTSFNSTRFIEKFTEELAIKLYLNLTALYTELHQELIGRQFPVFKLITEDTVYWIPQIEVAKRKISKNNFNTTLKKELANPLMLSNWMLNHSQFADWSKVYIEYKIKTVLVDWNSFIDTSIDTYSNKA